MKRANDSMECVAIVTYGIGKYSEEKLDEMIRNFMDENPEMNIDESDFFDYWKDGKVILAVSVAEEFDVPYWNNGPTDYEIPDDEEKLEYLNPLLDGDYEVLDKRVLR